MALTVAASAAQYLEGISEALPDGERVRWRGRPRAGLIARHVLRVRAVALYLGLMLGLSALTAWGQLAGPDLARVLVLPVLLVTIALGVTLLFAWLHARYSTYVITDRRVVMQVGIAIDMSINIPLRVVESADVVRYGDGSAAIALTLLPDFKIAWLALWPHAKTLEFQRPRPMLIGLAAPDAAAAAGALREAVAAEGELAGVQPATIPTPARGLADGALA